MTEQAYYLDQLTPLEALGLLAHAASAIPEGPQLLESFRLDASETVFGPQISLILPDQQGLIQNKSQKQRQEQLQQVISAYAQLKSSEPSRSPDRHEGIALGQGFAWLLLHSLVDRDDKAEPCFPEEFLLLGSQLGDQRAASLFEDLRFHATHCRVATASSQGQAYHFFHVLDDQERRSSFQAAEQSETFAGLTTLIGYGVGAHTLFLPKNVVPASRACALFVKLLAVAPNLIKITSLAESGPLLAIVSPEGEGSDQLFYLGALTFYGQGVVAPVKGVFSGLQVHDLQDSPARLERLRNALMEASPENGYRLELRAAKYQNTGELERLRLLERQAEVAYKLAYLDSVSQAKPRLFCFSEQQLPQLAKFVRSLPLEVLRQGYPLYGFQAQSWQDPQKTEARGGCHFLYLEPRDAIGDEWVWSDDLEKPKQFWLDPFWSRYYHGESAANLVFVPEQTVLFPTMHGWSTSEMNTYLREVLSELYHEGRGLEIPADPIYLFEGEPRPHQKISISVLDRAAFQPLYLRLGWINDHLQIGQSLDLDTYVQSLAHDLSRTELAKQVHERAELAEAEVEKLLLEVNRMTARRLGELTETVNQEISSVLEQTQVSAAYLKDVHLYLQDLTALGKVAQKTSSETFQSIVKTEGRNQELRRFMERLDLDIDHELHQADVARQKMSAKVQRSIKELGELHDRLRERLQEALRMRR